MTLFAELQRRNVLRAGVLYIGAVWAFGQGLSQFSPALGLPDWATRWFLFAAAIGFPFWLAFAWFYEFTPQGFQRESAVTVDAPQRHTNARKLDFAIIAVLAIAVVLLLANTFVQRKDADGGAAPEKSIAVLAFSDLSPDHNQGYFSDGMSEEILNALAQIDDLKVAGRTSSFYFRGRNEDLRTIGKALGVANILEGSVRKQGNEVRITAQLIRVADDTHLWSHAYDGDLSDVFKLQENIARAITGQLQVLLSGSQQARLVDAGTTNIEAYNLYLHATDALNQRNYKSMGDAVGWLQQAIALDPKFARAQSRLAMIHALGQARYGTSLSEIEPHARAALALDPSDVEAQVALGLLARHQRRSLDARAAMDRALELAPNDASVRLYAAQVLIDTGYTRQGIAQLDRALAIDPLLPNALYWRGRQYLYAGDTDTAEKLFEKADALGLSFAVAGRSAVARTRGDYALARKLSLPLIVSTAGSVDCPRNPAVDTPIYLDGVEGGNAVARDKAVAVLDACLAAHPAVVPMIVPFGLMLLDQPARTLAVAASAPTSDDAGLFMELWGPNGRDARRLPEFAEFARKVGFAELWDKYGPPELCKKNPAGDYLCG